MVKEYQSEQSDWDLNLFESISLMEKINFTQKQNVAETTHENK